MVVGNHAIGDVRPGVIGAAVLPAVDAAAVFRRAIQGDGATADAGLVALVVVNAAAMAGRGVAANDAAGYQRGKTSVVVYAAAAAIRAPIGGVPRDQAVADGRAVTGEGVDAAAVSPAVLFRMVQPLRLVVSLQYTPPPLPVALLFSMLLLATVAPLAETRIAPPCTALPWVKVKPSTVAAAFTFMQRTVS